MPAICTMSPQSNTFLSSFRAFRKEQQGLVGLSLIFCHSTPIACPVLNTKKLIVPAVTETDICTNTGSEDMAEVVQPVTYGEEMLLLVIGLLALEECVAQSLDPKLHI